jgi:hypothetical protein
VSGGYALYLKGFHKIGFIRTPLPLLTAFLFLMGINFILIGLVSELIIRTRPQSLHSKKSKIKEVVNISSEKS